MGALHQRLARRWIEKVLKEAESNARVRVWNHGHGRTVSLEIERNIGRAREFESVRNTDYPHNVVHHMISFVSEQAYASHLVGVCRLTIITSGL